MLTSKEQKVQVVLSNGTTAQLTPADLSSFLNSCQTIGIQPNDFGMMIHCITDDVIDQADDYSPTRELKKPLQFLRTLGTFLNSLEIN